MVREQDVFFVFGPACDFALFLLSGPITRRKLQTAAAGVTGFVVGYLPQLAAYAALNGHPGPSHFVTRKLTWYAPHALQVLFDPEHGFFAWTPLALVAIAGLVRLALRGSPAVRRIAGCAVLMVLLQVYISGVVESWTVAGAFGQRRFVALTIFLVLGLAAIWPARDATAAARRAFGVAVLLAAWWNVALIAEFGIGLMDRQRLELGKNAYHAFVTLPRLGPQLAYRYLFDRSSFYKPPAGAR
jgi:hypothetical protein